MTNPTVILDYVANFHLTGDPNVFNSYQPYDVTRSMVTTGGNVNVHGQGTVIIQLPILGEIQLDEVLYVPSSPDTLISVYCLGQADYSVSFDPGSKGAISRVTRKLPFEADENNMFTLQCKITHPTSLASCSILGINHQRLGHLSNKGLQQLGLTQDKPADCRACAEAEFPKWSDKPESKLVLVEHHLKPLPLIQLYLTTMSFNHHPTIHIPLIRRSMNFQ